MNTQLNDRKRRLATIMAADIVGYSRLMDTDEEGTYTALRAARSEVIEPKIEACGGRIVKHLGDGFLAEFPTVMSAIQLAMSLQEEMGRRTVGVPRDRQIKFRIGVNLGDVIVDDDGDVFGDGVYVAARLEPLAIPGPVYTSIQKKLAVKFTDLGYQRVKNISTPIHAYDIRWPGEAGTPDERAVKPTAKSKHPGLIAGSAMAVAAIIGLALWQMGTFEPGREAAPKNSLAVLPFLNMSDDAGSEYFSDGITEEILNLLARTPELKVISRSSAFSFKGKGIQIPEIARSLNVVHILEGSVRKAGDQVRITAQLIDARTDTHLWSETYDRNVLDVFTVQEDIAGELARQLELTLVSARSGFGTKNEEA